MELLDRHVRSDDVTITSSGCQVLRTAYSIRLVRNRSMTPVGHAIVVERSGKVVVESAMLTWHRTCPSQHERGSTSYVGKSADD